MAVPELSTPDASLFRPIRRLCHVSGGVRVAGRSQQSKH